MELNMGDLFESVAAEVPADHPALIHDDRTITWAELDSHSNQLANALLAAGLDSGSKVAFYMRNQPAYMELLIACFKSRLIHVNINYRFKNNELSYLFSNSDAEAVIYDAEFRPLIEALQPHHPQVKIWVEIAAPQYSGGDCQALPDFAVDYDQLLAQGDSGRLDIQRSPDDLLFIYTGGTTGMPKAVMWRQGDLLTAQFNSLAYLENSRPPTELAQVLERVRTTSMHTRQLPAAPLMHATAVVVAFGAIMGGGCVVTLPDRGHGFDPAALWQAVDRHRVTTLTIVGDSFAKPLLAELKDNRECYRLDTLAGIISSGVIWSPTVKQALLGQLPNVMLLDNFGSTEAPACGTAIATRDSGIQQPVFKVGEDCKVFAEDGREIQPGSGEAGLVARAGPLPLGYYKDPEKTAKTFRTYQGVRYAIPGDHCKVAADGTLQLLGRDSQCINSGGEKIFAEEVEEVIKLHPAVADALVVGVPDPQWGQIVVAVVTLQAGKTVTSEQIQAQVRDRLADYKTPKQVLFNAAIERLPNGKADYQSAKTYALNALGISP